MFGTARAFFEKGVDKSNLICYNVGTTNRKEIKNMEIIFRSIDGVEFNTAQECIEHENKFCRFKMWNQNGLVSTPMDAMLVQFESASYEAKEAFIELCRRHDVTTEGVEETTEYDWYMWYDDEFQWIPIENDVIESLRKCLVE